MVTMKKTWVASVRILLPFDPAKDVEAREALHEFLTFNGKQEEHILDYIMDGMVEVETIENYHNTEGPEMDEPDSPKWQWLEDTK